MPKKFPESVKLEAMRLFVAGDKTAKEIAEEISTPETEVKPAVPVKVKTVSLLKL